MAGAFPEGARSDLTSVPSVPGTGSRLARTGEIGAVLGGTEEPLNHRTHPVWLDLPRDAPTIGETSCPEVELGP